MAGILYHYIGAIAKPSRIKVSSPYSKRPTYSLFFLFLFIRVVDVVVCSFLEQTRRRRRLSSRDSYLSLYLLSSLMVIEGNERLDRFDSINLVLLFL
jgi:hypothetical protein